MIGGSWELDYCTVVDLGAIAATSLRARGASMNARSSGFAIQPAPAHPRSMVSMSGGQDNAGLAAISIPFGFTALKGPNLVPLSHP